MSAFYHRSKQSSLQSPKALTMLPTMNLQPRPQTKALERPIISVNSDTSRAYGDNHYYLNPTKRMSTEEGSYRATNLGKSRTDLTIRTSAHLYSVRNMTGITSPPKSSMSYQRVGRSLPFALNVDNVDLFRETQQQFGEEFASRPAEGISMSVSPRLKAEYDKQQKLLKENPHIKKFTQYCHLLGQSTVRNSAMSKDTFYYADQIEINRKLEQKTKELQKREDMLLFQMKTLKDGHKETFDVQIGTVNYFKVDCVDKTFPLHVKAQPIQGMFEIYVSKSTPKPDKRDCDFTFNVTKFDVEYPSTREIETLYFAIKGVGRLKIAVTVSFHNLKEEIKNVRAVTRASNARKLTAPSYEFFKKHMTSDEEKELEEVVLEIKRERNTKHLNKNIVKQNKELVPDFPQFQKARRLIMTQAREWNIKHNEVNHKVALEGKKKKAMVNSMKNDVIKLQRTWQRGQDAETAKKEAFQKQWLFTLTAVTLFRRLHEKKQAARVLRLIKKFRENSAILVQRRFRLFKQRTMVPSFDKIAAQSEERCLKEGAGFYMRDIYRVLNSAALILRKSLPPKAGKYVVKVFNSLLPHYDMLRIMAEYLEKVKLIQKRWRAQAMKVRARVQVFTSCFNQYMIILANDAKEKGQAPPANKFKRIQLHRCARDFVFAKMKDVKYTPLARLTTVLILAPTFERSGTRDFTPVNKKKMPATMRALFKESFKKEALMKEGAPDSKDANHHELGSDTPRSTRSPTHHRQQPQQQQKYKFKPTREELKHVYDWLLAEANAPDHPGRERPW